MQRLGRRTRRGNDMVRLLSLSSPRLTGRSSIPETPVLEPIGRGVLDPLSRVMTTENLARISKHDGALPRRERARVLRQSCSLWTSEGAGKAGYRLIPAAPVQ